MPISITITADTPAELSGWLRELKPPAAITLVPMTTHEKAGSDETAEVTAGIGLNYSDVTAVLAPHMTQNTSAEPAPAPTEAKVDKPKRTRAAKADPTIPPTAEAYEAALGEPNAVVSAATSDAGEKSEGSTAGTDTSGATTSTSSIATTGASPSDTTDLAVVRTRVQNKLRELGTIAGGGRGSVTEVLNEINGGNIGAMTCPAENLPRLEAAVDARLAALKGAA